MLNRISRINRRVPLSIWQQLVSRFGERKAREMMRGNRIACRNSLRGFATRADPFSLIHRLVHAASVTHESASERRKKLSPVIRDILWVAKEDRLLT